LGFGIVKALVQTYSARVVALSRKKSSELAGLPPTVHSIECDITNEEAATSAIKQTIDKFGRLDSLVLNAGTLDPVTRLENASPSSWKESFNINLFANIPLVLAVLPHLMLDTRIYPTFARFTRVNYIHFLWRGYKRLYRLVSLLRVQSGGQFPRAGSRVRGAEYH
jgi:NAD(P)-dependent dehydrogenase (short-subunit alcohol dehydrogenase family)